VRAIGIVKAVTVLAVKHKARIRGDMMAGEEDEVAGLAD